jgi:uncharacterized protein DUF4154
MHLRRYGFSLALLLIASIAVQAATAATPEYEVKAAFLYKFANFADIPAATPGPFIVTILGEDPFGEVLDDAVRGKTIAGRPVQVRRTHDIAESAGSGIVFVSASERERMREILDVLRNTKTLTVSDMGGFAAAGGMIEFVIDQNRIGLEINEGAADEAGIHINAKLLALARVISTER